MKELIKITDRYGEQVVSARELHKFLEVDSVFTTWCKRMFEYGFEDGKDFVSILEESTGGRRKTDFALTLDTAKEISMLQRSEKGKQARQYFIDMEKKAREGVVKLPSTKELAEMVIQAEEEKERLRIEGELKDKQLKIQAPKVEYHDQVLQSKSTYTVNQIAKELGTSAKTLNKTLAELKVQYKQSGVWLLYHKYQNKGYTKTRTYKYTSQDGTEQTAMQTVWTEVGRKFIHDLLDQNGAVEVAS